MSGTVVRGLLLVPSLEPLAALFCTDPEHAALARLASDLVARAKDHALFFHTGTDGRSAPEVAALCAARGCAEVLVLGGRHDRAAMLQLEAALARCVPRVASARGDAVLPRLADWLPCEPSPALSAPRRAAPPAALRCAELDDDACATDSSDVVLALPVAGPWPEPELLARRWRERTRDRASRGKLWIDDREAELPSTARDSDWGLRHGLGDPALRAFVGALLEHGAPERRLAYAVAERWWQLGVDPLAEMYAGNALADRNRELLRIVLP